MLALYLTNNQVCVNQDRCRQKRNQYFGMCFIRTIVCKSKNKSDIRVDNSIVLVAMATVKRLTVFSLFPFFNYAQLHGCIIMYAQVVTPFKILFYGQDMNSCYKKSRYQIYRGIYIKIQKWFSSLCQFLRVEILDVEINLFHTRKLLYMYVYIIYLLI